MTRKLSKASVTFEKVSRKLSKVSMTFEKVCLDRGCLCGADSAAST